MTETLESLSGAIAAPAALRTMLIDIYRPSDRQELLAERANGKLRVQALYTELDCKLSDLCDLLPDKTRGAQKRWEPAGNAPVRLYRSKTTKDRGHERESISPGPHQLFPPTQW